MTDEALYEVPVDGPARAVFTFRGVRTGDGPWDGLNLGADCGDDPAHVRANRRRLAGALGIDPEAVSMVHQVHGAAVVDVDTPLAPGLFTGALRGWPEADALVAHRPGLPLMVLGADCLPVLMWRRDRPSVAAAHAGWRGLVAGVLEAAAGRLGDGAGVAAAIGPGIGPCCYEVSEEVRTRFARRFGDGVIAGRAVDLAGSARTALRAAGVPDGAIATVAVCTACGEGARHFSYRASGGTCGRQAGIVWATDGGGEGA